MDIKHVLLLLTLLCFVITGCAVQVQPLPDRVDTDLTHKKIDIVQVEKIGFRTCGIAVGSMLAVYAKEISTGRTRWQVTENIVATSYVSKTMTIEVNNNRYYSRGFLRGIGTPALLDDLKQARTAKVGFKNKKTGEETITKISLDGFTKAYDECVIYVENKK